MSNRLSNAFQNLKRIVKEHPKTTAVFSGTIVSAPFIYYIYKEYNKRTLPGEKMPFKEFLIIGCCGATSQLISDFSLHAVDTINVRLKSTHADITVKEMSKRIHKKYGIRGFFNGLSATICGSITGGFVYFTAYMMMKNIMKKFIPHEEEFIFLRNLFSAGLTEFVALIVFYPFEMVKTRMQSNRYYYNYNNVFDGLKQVWNEDKKLKWMSFYKGSFPYFLMFICYTAIQFSCYETLIRQYSKRNKNHEPNFSSILTSSILSGAIASLMTNWIEVMTIQKQLDSSRGLLQIFRLTGISIFYKGIATRLLSNCFQSLIIFVALENLCSFFKVRFED